MNFIYVLNWQYFIVNGDGCDYPTFYDSDDGQCVMTCPSGTYGVVNGASGNVSLNYTRNCTTSK